MGFNRLRCEDIVRQQRANYPYLNPAIAYKVIGRILATRRKKKVHITADFQPTLEHLHIPLQQQRGYAQVAADYFNQKGSLIKHGTSYGMYKRDKKKVG